MDTTSSIHRISMDQSHAIHGKLPPLQHGLHASCDPLSARVRSFEPGVSRLHISSPRRASVQCVVMWCVVTRVGKTFQRSLVCIILCCISHGRLNVWFKIVCAEACSSPVRTSLDYLQFSHRPKQRSDGQQSSTAATECNARVSNPWACEAARHSGVAAEHSTVTMPWEACCWETAPVHPSESCWRKTWHAKENMLLTLLRPLKLQNISGNSGHFMNWSTIINHLRSAPTPGQLWPWKSPPWASLLGASSAPPRTSSWQPPIAPMDRPPKSNKSSTKPRFL